MPAPNTGSVVRMLRSAGRLKLFSKATSAARNAAPSSVPPAPVVAAAAFRAKLVKGVTMLVTVPPEAVTMERKALPAGRFVELPVTSSV